MPHLVFALVASAALISACGGSSSTGTSATQSAASSLGKSSTRIVAGASRDVVTDRVVVHKPLHGTGGRELNDDNPGTADVGKDPAAGQSDPCALVSRTQAQAIVHKPIGTPQEAPLGPTCIYQPRGAKTFITLSLEGLDFAKVRPAIRGRIQYTIGGRAAYCGVYGQPTTFVPLSDGKVLDVTAPCAIGKLFAAEALASLHT